MSKQLLSNKVLGIIITTQENLSISQLADYTRESEEDISEVVDELIKANKLEWNDK